MVVPAVLTKKRGWCRICEPERAATGLAAGVDEREVDSGGCENEIGRKASTTGKMASSRMVPADAVAMSQSRECFDAFEMRILGERDLFRNDF